MSKALQEEFEATYRTCFPIAAELQPNLFSFELDDGEYVEAKVHVAFTLWQAARATAVADQPATLTDNECEQIANIINMNRKTFCTAAADSAIHQVRAHKHSNHWVDCSEAQYDAADDTPRRRIVYGTFSNFEERS
jgi:hypothetical protein